jgi:hypothetical protein
MGFFMRSRGPEKAFPVYDEVGNSMERILLCFPKRKCKFLLILSPCTYCVKMKG